MNANAVQGHLYEGVFMLEIIVFGLQEQDCLFGSNIRNFSVFLRKTNTSNSLTKQGSIETKLLAVVTAVIE